MTEKTNQPITDAETNEHKAAPTANLDTFKTSDVYTGILHLVLCVAAIFFGFSLEAVGALISTIGAILTIFCLFGFKVVSPREAVIVQQFGVPIGKFHTPGIHYTAFWLTKKTVSLADENKECPNIKVNDIDGTPLIISGSYSARIYDAEKYIYELEQDKNTFLDSRMQGVIRNQVKLNAYHSSDETKTTLANDAEEICKEIERIANKSFEKYGIEIFDFAFSEMAYAPEIAANMTQVQQAKATIEAKKQLSTGVTAIISSIIEEMDKSESYKLTDEDKSRMARELMVVMISTKEASPVLTIND